MPAVASRSFSLLCLGPATLLAAGSCVTDRCDDRGVTLIPCLL